MMDLVTKARRLVPSRRKRVILRARLHVYESPDRQFDTTENSSIWGSFGSMEAPDAAPRVAEHICTEWDENHDDELTSVTMYRIDELVARETIDDPANRDHTAVGTPSTRR